VVKAMAAIGTPATVRGLSSAIDDADPDKARVAILGIEPVAGISYADSRIHEEGREAWRR